MRHSTAIRRLLALATLTVLAAGTLSLSGPALARDPSGNGAGALFGEGGKGFMTGSGTRGMVDPKNLPERPQDSVQQSAKPFLTGPTSGAIKHLVSAPAGVPVPPDPVEITQTTNPPAGLPGVNGFAQNSGPATNFQPPDPWVAVGPEHVIQVVNSSVQILGRTGNVIESRPLSNFFSLRPGFQNADPRVIFDSLHQRWVMTEVSWTCAPGGGGFGYIDYLVSSGPDPTDSWRLDFIEFANALPSFPAPGTSTVNVGFAANIYNMDTTPAGDCLGAGVTFAGTDMLFADWAEVVRPPAPPATTIREFPLLGARYFTARVALQTPSTSPTLHTIFQYDDPTYGLVPRYVAFEGSAVADTLVPIAAHELTPEGVVARWVDAPPHPVQPGIPVVTADIDSRPSDAIWQSDKLTWVSTEGCTPSGDVSLQDCVRVTQIDTSVVDSPQPIQDFLIAEANHDNYFGGIGMALDGTLHVVWTTSSASIYPSSYTAYQLRGDPDNSVSAPERLKAGVGPSFTGGHWGDYVGVAQDSQVVNAVWQGNMYSGGGDVWKTYISQLQTGGSSYVPIPPVRVLDTRPAFSIGLSGPFTPNVPRTFQVSGALGIPAAAIAVTGNVTVANQTAGGYLSVSPTPVANPRSSTINFPLGDTRANNLTVPLAPDGKLAAVYKAPAGQTTHLIVDITGYFLAGPEDATYAPVTPVRVLDSRSGIGLAGGFAPNVPRKLTIAGSHGIPADAVAITGNLTVAGQTGAGYLSITKTSIANPPTSTLNFPLGDVRANGVSVPLNGAGALWIVYKAPAGATTDVILDVTGYYRNDPSGLLFYPLSPGRIMDTRPGSSNGLPSLTGPFLANTPRRLQVAGHWGAPASAAAVTGNLTVVNQTAGGYVSATLNSEVNPTTSSLNFPLGDTRANGVTLPLNAGGRSWFVYKAGAGKQTHLILDLSGYFN